MIHIDLTRPILGAQNKTRRPERQGKQFTTSPIFYHFTKPTRREKRPPLKHRPAAARHTSSKMAKCLAAASSLLSHTYKSKTIPGKATKGKACMPNMKKPPPSAPQ